MFSVNIYISYERKYCRFSAQKSGKCMGFFLVGEGGALILNNICTSKSLIINEYIWNKIMFFYHASKMSEGNPLLFAGNSLSCAKHLPILSKELPKYIY